jgi:hypothetical protein
MGYKLENDKQHGEFHYPLVNVCIAMEIKSVPRVNTYKLAMASIAMSVY